MIRSLTLAAVILAAGQVAGAHAGGGYGAGARRSAELSGPVELRSTGCAAFKERAPAGPPPVSWALHADCGT